VFEDTGFMRNFMEISISNMQDLTFLEWPESKMFIKGEVVRRVIMVSAVQEIKTSLKVDHFIGVKEVGKI